MLEKFDNKKICILGFGLEGQATFEYLKKHGIRAFICDKDKDFLSHHPEFNKEEVKIGEDYLKTLDDFDIVFKTPGISPLKPEIIAASTKGVEFTSQIEEFFQNCPCPIIGITGTKGKGTTSTLIFDILKAQGKDVYLGGNIGVPAIDFIDKLNKDSLVVLELSSFQLQVLKQSPHIAVVLNITSEHLDYHASTEEYRESKKNIVKHQDLSDFAVINDDYEIPRSFAKETKAKVFNVSKEHLTNGCFVDKEDNIVLMDGENKVILAAAKELLLRGRHNLENVTAAAMAAYLAGAQPEVISGVLRNFKGLEHRLELVRELEKIKYYNDSFSTVPETAIAAIDSFEEPIVLIAGGSYKGSNYQELGKKIANSKVKAVILIGDMAEEIAQNIPKDYRGELILGLTKMDEIVAKATSFAKEGDVVLLSPACASFGLFKNYKDRGNQFKQAVNNL